MNVAGRTTTEAPQEPGVIQAVGDMQRALHGLSAALAEMGTRTQRICKPDPPVPTGSGHVSPAEPIRSPLADEINAQVRMVRDFEERIRHTLDRLEV